MSITSITGSLLNSVSSVSPTGASPLISSVDSDGEGNGSARLSGLAQAMSKLQTLEKSDPAKAKQVLSDIANKLQAKGKELGGAEGGAAQYAGGQVPAGGGERRPVGAAAGGAGAGGAAAGRPSRAPRAPWARAERVRTGADADAGPDAVGARHHQRRPGRRRRLESRNRKSQIAKGEIAKSRRREYPRYRFSGD